MTTEKFTEELLYQSHSLGIKDELWKVVTKLREDNPHLTTHEAIHEAYYTLTN